ncbi:MAG: PIN domain-containing protein [Nitrococcus sp.]|nr:PIN domain-containing protein [Nitrococcus sp.]
MPIFVDTNVLVYRFDTTEPEKQARCEDWLQWLWTQGTGRLSMQVLQELYATLTRKLPRALNTTEAQTATRALFAWNPVVVERSVIEGAWANQERFSLSWWDALIVAAAQQAECTHLLTEDLNHNQDIDGVRVIDPMQVEPGALSL